MVTLYELAGRDAALRFSPYCWRIRFALAHKGIEAELIPWRFHEKARLPGAPANSTVPVLVDRRAAIAESAQIADHLETHYAHGPSLFGCQAGRAHAAFIVGWTDRTLIPMMAPAVAPFVFPLLHKADRDYYRSTREQRLGATLESLHEEAPARMAAARAALPPLRVTLEHAAFIGGEEPTYADYAVFSAVQWARCVGAPALITPEDTLARWQDDMLSLFDGLAGNARTA